MVRSSLFLQQGMSQWSCSVKLFVNVKIEPAIDEPIISSQQIKIIFLEDLRYGSDLSGEETFQNWPPE